MEALKSMAKDILEKKVRIFTETIWKDKIEDGLLGKWLENFNHADLDIRNQERLNALYLLSKFLYYGNKETREMLRCIYRDKFQYKVIQKIRKENTGTSDLILINNHFEKSLSKTRFLGVGNPSESGVHLLYYFRQENGLAKDLFLNSYEIFKIDDKNNIKLARTDIDRYIFLDDFCGSGQQAVNYSTDIVSNIKKLDSKIQVDYFPLFATEEGIDRVRQYTLFDNIDPVFTLDASYKAFDVNSRYFTDFKEEVLIDKSFAKVTCENYGAKLFYHALGYNNCQLLLAFFTIHQIILCLYFGLNKSLGILFLNGIINNSHEFRT